jgi:hypothetical protein
LLIATPKYLLFSAFWYLQTFGHCIVCLLIYGFWLPFGIFTLLAIVFSVLELQFLIIHLVSYDYHYGIFWLQLKSSVSYDYTFDIFWLHLWYFLITPLISSDCNLNLRYLLITPLVSWLPLWCLLIIHLVSSDCNLNLGYLLWIIRRYQSGNRMIPKE